MKTEQKEIVLFNPIVITLETREEAELMRAMVNSSIHSLEGSGAPGLETRVDIGKVSEKMFDSFMCVWREGGRQ